MRPAAKKSASKTRSKKPVAATAAAQGNGWVLLRLTSAYFLAVFVLISVLSIGSISGSKPHWMGPYLGTLLAKNLGVAFGLLPSVLFLAALAFTSVRIFTRSHFPSLLRITLGVWSIFLSADLLLAARVARVSALSRVQLEQNGGLFGVFVVQHLLEPLFGASRLVPALLGCFGLLGALIFAFGLRPRHFQPLIHWLGAVSHDMGSKAATMAKPLDAVNSTSLKLPPAEIGVMVRNEDTSDFPVLRRGQVRPFQADGFRDPIPERVLVAPAPVAIPVPQAPPPPPLTPGDHNAAIQAIEAQLKNARSMDPREVRKLRDELAELRRVSEINNWEDRKLGQLKIEGIVRSDDATIPVMPVSQSLSISAQKTVIEAEMRPVTAKQRAQVTEESLVPEIAPQIIFPDALPQVVSRAEKPFGTHSGIYQLPLVGAVLGDVPVQPVDYSPDELKQFGAMLEQQLENFRVKGKVVNIAAGPVITRFEIEPGPGVKVSKFAGLSDDLALALKANSIRVLAPIPGKSAVGIEIPNRKAQTVYCREILESPRFMPDPYTLQIVLGKDIMGNAFVMDLARAPHLLIAGQTGSGKSVCINTLMASLLFSKSPDDLRMILVDPKVVELKSYENIPHLLHPVVTDPGTAVQALQWACYEMDRRYDLLAKAGVRNIAGFNQKFAKGELDSFDGILESDKRRMPFIVIVVDEFADVIMQAKKEFEDPVIRLAQKARAAGMHMVLATQRPSTNVITGIIKANLPTRISFKVASHIDARTVLDHAGAEKLLGRGDMLFRSIDDPEPIRVHGAFLTDNEAELVARSCSEQEVDYPQLSSFQVGSPDKNDGVDPMNAPDQDELFWDAAELCALQGGGSTSLLQRRFSIGYSRAGRIMDGLYKAGIVGPERGSKPRECLVGADEIAQIRRTRGQ